MPIYQYRCDCGQNKELILPISERNNPRYCECGKEMGRVMELPFPALFPSTGRDKILNTLNKEAGYKVRSKRSTEALARGLNPLKEVRGRGF